MLEGSPVTLPKGHEVLGGDEAREGVAAVTERHVKAVDLHETMRGRPHPLVAPVDLGLGTGQHLTTPVQRWSGYFRFGDSSRKFNVIDSDVAERMAILASFKYGLSGRNWGTRFTYEWFESLGVYTLSGKVTYRIAHARQ